MNDDVQSLSFFQFNNTTQPNTTQGYANTMTINMPKPLQLTNSEIGLLNFFCYYSWPNVSTMLNNNAFFYNVPASGTTWNGTNYNIETIPGTGVISDGIYNISDLNNVLQFTLTNNGHYFIDNNSNNVYPLSFKVNPTSYSVELTALVILNPLPTGWTYPTSGASPFTISNTFNNTTLRLNIPASTYAAGNLNIGQSSISKILGLAPGNYPATVSPASTVTLQFSGITPQITTTNSVNIACNLVNASFISPIAGNIIYSFSPTSVSGTQIQEKPSVVGWLPITDGLYNQVVIRLVTDSFTPLNILDPAVSATLLIRKKIQLPTIIASPSIPPTPPPAAITAPSLFPSIPTIQNFNSAYSKRQRQ